MAHTSFIDKLIRDKNGAIALAQVPNLPLIGWAVFGILAFLISGGVPHRGFQNLSRALLFVWAYLEIRSGDSLARRILGVIVMIILIAGFFGN